MLHNNEPRWSQQKAFLHILEKLDVFSILLDFLLRIHSLKLLLELSFAYWNLVWDDIIFRYENGKECTYLIVSFNSIHALHWLTFVCQFISLGITTVMHAVQNLTGLIKLVVYRVEVAIALTRNSWDQVLRINNEWWS